MIAVQKVWPFEVASDIDKGDLRALRFGRRRHAKEAAGLVVTVGRNEGDHRVEFSRLRQAREAVVDSTEIPLQRPQAIGGLPRSPPDPATEAIKHRDIK